MGTIPECFENYIGVRHDCNTLPPPTSGLYINDLEGMSLDTASAIVNGEDVSGLNLMRQKIAFATGLVLDDLKAFVMPNFRLNTIVEIIKTGSFGENYLPLFNGERGVVIKKTANAKAQTITINTITILAATSYSQKKVTIIDGGLRYDYFVDLVPYVESEISVNQSFKSSIVYIVMDNSDIEVNSGQNSFKKANCNCGDQYYGNENFFKDNKKYLKVAGWNGTAEENKVFGIVADVSLTCDMDYIYCMIAPMLKYVILYRSGIELVKEWLVSNRLNEFTTLKSKQAEFLLGIWTEEYNNKYKVLAETITPAIKKIDDVCVLCRGIGYGYQV